MILFPIIAFSQKAEKEFSKAELAKREKAQRQSQAFAYQGYQAEKAHKLLDSEMDYRKAISKNKENAVAQYNMGDVLYSQEAYNEATHYYQEASVNKEASKETISPHLRLRILNIQDLPNLYLILGSMVYAVFPRPIPTCYNPKRKENSP